MHHPSFITHHPSSIILARCSLIIFSSPVCLWLVASQSYDPTTHFETTVNDVLEMYTKITGKVRSKNKAFLADNGHWEKERKRGVAGEWSRLSQHCTERQRCRRAAPGLMAAAGHCMRPFRAKPSAAGSLSNHKVTNAATRGSGARQLQCLTARLDRT